MIKDIVVNLSLGDRRDAATELAVDLASKLEAHIAGLALTYEPFIPAAEMVVPQEMIDMQRDENERLSSAAIARFDELARRNSVSAETRNIESPASMAPDIFARVARRFDLAVVSQPR